MLVMRPYSMPATGIVVTVLIALVGGYFGINSLGGDGAAQTGDNTSLSQRCSQENAAEQLDCRNVLFVNSIQDYWVDALPADAARRSRAGVSWHAAAHALTRELKARGADTAVEVGLVDRAWLEEPGHRPIRTAPALEVVERFLERSVERQDEKGDRAEKR